MEYLKRVKKKKKKKKKKKYYNYYYFFKYDEALAIYEKAIKFAIENLGKDHELVN